MFNCPKRQLDKLTAFFIEHISPETKVLMNIVLISVFVSEPAIEWTNSGLEVRDWKKEILILVSTHEILNVSKLENASRYPLIWWWLFGVGDMVGAPPGQGECQQ